VILHYYDHIFVAMERDDAISAEWACRQLLQELRPHVRQDVAVARQNGATWTRIGQGLGISSQAAGKRFRRAIYSPH
jgi:hypothetical protein